MLKIFAARLEFCDFRIGRLNSEKSSACIRAGADELHGLLLPEGLPLKVEWGIPDKDKNLPNALTTVTLNASASFTLNAPEIWMHVPGRDINEVARELRDQREAGEEKNTDAEKE